MTMCSRKSMLKDTIAICRKILIEEGSWIGLGLVYKNLVDPMYELMYFDFLKGLLRVRKRPPIGYRPDSARFI